MADFGRLRALLAALTPVGVVACSEVERRDELVAFESEVCLEREDGLADLSLARQVDYVALRMTAPSFEDPPKEVPAHTIAAWGTACATAGDAAACNASVEALAQGQLVSVGGFDGVTEYDLAITHGDVVETITTRAALLELLGAIDTPNEAALLAFVDGHRLVCGDNNVVKTSDGYILLGTRGDGCGEGNDRVEYEVEVASNGTVTGGESVVVEVGDPNCAIGRRPQALRSRAARGRSVGSFFAQAAHLEAASVPAFEQLAVELSVHGAPRGLVRAAWRSRADEIRHVAMTTAMSRRFGVIPERPVLGPRHVRSLASVAIDNAAEGCVRETFGALVAAVQARRARYPWLRRGLARIAADEARHATFSWALDAWARERLTAGERRAVDEARRRAAEQLLDEVTVPLPPEVTRVAGMPDAETSARLSRALGSRLWHVAA